MTHLEKMQKWATDIALMPPVDRRPILLAWARADQISGFLFEDSPLSDIASEAIKILSAELKAETVGNAWARTPFAEGRRHILNALRIDPSEPTAAFATFPFRLMRLPDSSAWIGAAIHPPSPRDPSPHTEIDITYVILWNPRTAELRLLGDTQPAIIGPDRIGDRLTIYGEGYAFFRAWADARAEIAQRHIDAHVGNWAHPVAEPRDGAIPGAIVIGDLNKVAIPLDVPVFEAGPGIDPSELRMAIFRRANLPRVQSKPEPIRRAA